MVAHKKNLQLFLWILAISLLSQGVFSADLKTTRAQAEQGNAAAQFDLGAIYDQGDGVERNYAEAAKWYRIAAEQGEAAAQYNLAIMYDTGEGVNKDIVQAYAWMGAAEVFGYTGANESSNDFLPRMTPEQIKQGDLAIMEIVNRINENKENILLR